MVAVVDLVYPDPEKEVKGDGVVSDDLFCPDPEKEVKEEGVLVAVFFSSVFGLALLPKLKRVFSYLTFSTVFKFDLTKPEQGIIELRD